MAHGVSPYLMENDEESIRLEIKTRPEEVREQARWCGVGAGMRVLDAGCGPGITTAILHESVGVDGEIVGVDYSPERIAYARSRYERPGMRFEVHDLRNPLEEAGRFDLVWVRFVLEYNRGESAAIVENLARCLKPGGRLCLLDLDHNCLSHYELPARLERGLFKLMGLLEQVHDFDPYAGRKLYAYLYDRGFRDIELRLSAHHLMYGAVRDEDLFNWIKKVEVSTRKAKELLGDYPGGREGFFADFRDFFLHPRRFTYTPLIMARGVKTRD